MSKNFLEFDIKTNVKLIDESEARKTFFDESLKLSARLAQAYANNLKITLSRVRAIATGDTLRSVKDEFVLKSPSRYLVQSRVVASRSIVFIQKGRQPGKKAPVRLVGTDERGKKIWEPLPSLLRWLQVLNIPKVAWLPIAWKIKRDGIKPREVQQRALNSSKSAFQSAITAFLAETVRKLFKELPR